MERSPRVVSFFSGGGGLDLGFAAAGFEILFSSDIDEFSCNTLKINQGKVPYYPGHEVEQKDIREFDSAYWMIRNGLRRGDIDFLIGGPPCQAFSVFGRRKGLDDPRGNLVFEYARVIEELEPTGFLFENVAGLKTIHNGSLYKDLIKLLSFDGKYSVATHEYQVAEYGIPQFRRRIFFIGSKNKRDIPALESTHAQSDSLYNNHRPFLTAGLALNGLDEPGSRSSFYNHVGRKHSDRIIERYANMEFGERDAHTRINRLDPNRPSYTIIVGSDMGGGKGHVHPFFPREVTPRESARLQTFPDWWEFSGTGRHVIRQVGNAVPPLFAAQLAAHIKKELFEFTDPMTFDQLVKTLRLNFLESENDYRSL